MVKSVLAGLLAAVILIFGSIIGADLALRSTMQVDLIGSAAHAIALTQPVNKDEIVTNPFDESYEMKDVQDEINNSVANMITYSEENGYWVNFTPSSAGMRSMISLSDKQVGALASIVIKQEAAGQIQIKDLYMDVEIYQVEFEKNEEGNAIVNSVIGINTTSFKSIIPDAFPLANIKNIIPDILYISSTNEVIKGEESFEYNVEHVDFTINNLSKEQTESLFYTLDTLMGVGSAEYINVQIGTTLMHALVGNGANKGLAYSLKEYGAKDFDFVQHGSDIYFEVQR
ncbi:MAG: hypothetical protein J6C61_09235 [Clostridia bacterium]|nr:hypothetical protein [Clostridia bacterium]